MRKYNKCNNITACLGYVIATCFRIALYVQKLQSNETISVKGFCDYYFFNHLMIFFNLVPANSEETQKKNSQKFTVKRLEKEYV